MRLKCAWIKILANASIDEFVACGGRVNASNEKKAVNYGTKGVNENPRVNWLLLIEHAY